MHNRVCDTKLVLKMVCCMGAKIRTEYEIEMIKKENKSKNYD